MIEKFLTSVEIQTKPALRVFDEELGIWKTATEAEYYTQSFLMPRPETKVQADLDRVIRLNKPAWVIARFEALVQLGLDWDWCDEYVHYTNDLYDFVNFVPVQEYDELGEPLPLVVLDEPVLPVHKKMVIVSYSERRVAEYPSMEEFADAYVHMVNGDPLPLEQYAKKCLDIKAKFPKS